MTAHRVYYLKGGRVLTVLILRPMTAADARARADQLCPDATHLETLAVRGRA